MINNMSKEKNKNKKQKKQKKMQAELNPTSGSRADRLFADLDLAFTIVFTLELAVNVTVLCVSLCV